GVHEGVVARVARLVREFADDEIHLVRREADTVDEIDRARAPTAKILKEGAGIAVSDVSQRGAFLGREPLGPEAQCRAGRAGGVGEAEEQVFVLVGWRADDDLAAG